MIKRYTYGSPFQTEAVIEQIQAIKEKPSYFKVNKEEDSYTLVYKMDKNDGLFGLGENIRGINKRGYIYKSNCSDDPSHDEGKSSLYGAHNFLIVKGSHTFGIFIDMPSSVTFDCGYTQKDQLVITVSSIDFDLYIIEEESFNETIKRFRKLIGRSYIPPKWAFGYQQSRWGYRNEEDVQKVVDGYRNNHIPLDAVYMDIDFMERFKNFTVDSAAFKDFKQVVSDLKDKGIRLVPIVDAGVKIEEGYDVYEEGVAHNYFCKDEQGEDFVAAVWPGKVHFPDFLNKEAREWFGKKYKVLLDQGIEGFWNDMNEPAIFYTPEGLQEAFQKLDHIRQCDNIGIYEFFGIKDIMNGISNSASDYERFYHQVGDQRIRHDKVHNLFGYNMTRAAGEAFDVLEPNKRILLFSRASYIGMHRYGGIWTGDNTSWWSHLLMNIKMMPSLNMCGILYTGADIGGFGGNSTEDLVLRWLQFGCFTPLMRNHSALGTREQEAYQFQDIGSFRNIIGIRYGMIPYLYSEYMKAALRDEMYFKTLMMAYPEDAFAENVEDQLMVGESIMIAPVYEQNARGRYVYLPEDMLMVKLRSLTDREYKIMDKGHHYVDIALEEMVFFIKPNHVVPLSKGAEYVDGLDEMDLELCGYVKDKATYELYQDDGFSKYYDSPNNWSTLQVIKEDNQIQSISSKDALKISLNIY
ncbi:MAG: alpha-glucosidase [Cellulosilyticum sp.]|nr:alpha-glucosidase [Cellulosilyticum sp.]